MRKLNFIIVALILLMQTAAHAVELETGVELALSKANFKVKDNAIPINNTLGFGLGASAKALFSKVNVGPEIWFFHHNATCDKGGKLKSNALELPVVVSYNIIGPLLLEAGPSFSLLSIGKYKYEDETTKLGRIRPEMGYTVGAKVTVLKMLTVSGRFNGCFTRQSVSYGLNTVDVRYNAWSLAVGAKF